MRPHPGTGSALDALSERVEAAFRGGADWLQIRERGAASDRDQLTAAHCLAEAARRGARGAGAAAPCVIVNRRSDIALAIGADGVHLGFDAVAIEDARRLLGERARIGVSAHSAAEVAEASRAGADYVHLAPIFDPLSKAAERAPLGLAALREACGHGIAVFAQGGIDARTAASVIGVGAAGVAVTGALLATRDAAETEMLARGLRSAIDVQSTPASR